MDDQSDASQYRGLYTLCTTDVEVIFIGKQGNAILGNLITENNNMFILNFMDYTYYIYRLV
jgi:hypothetical protein